jgi:hypothetical protein
MITPRIKKGQVYRDVDPRADGRTIKVIDCAGARVKCMSDRKGRIVRIRKDRLLDLKLYVLVSDS